MAWEFSNNLNWDLILRETYIGQSIPTTPPTYLPIPPKLISLDAKVVLIGTRNDKAKSSWYTAGWVSPRLNFSPSSTSQFGGLVQGESRRRLSLNRLNLVRFENFDLNPYAIELNIARWHSEMLVEIWKYSGNQDDINTVLERIEGKIDTQYGQ